MSVSAHTGGPRQTTVTCHMAASGRMPGQTCQRRDRRRGAVARAGRLRAMRRSKPSRGRSTRKRERAARPVNASTCGIAASTAPGCAGVSYSFLLFFGCCWPAAMPRASGAARRRRICERGRACRRTTLSPLWALV